MKCLWIPVLRASVDIITRQDFRKLQGIKPTKTNRRLMPYGSKQALKLDGEFLAQTKAGRKEVLSCWIIAAHGDVSLLSGATAELLGLVKRLETANTLKQTEKSAVRLTLSKVLKDNQEVFRDELGQMADLTANLKLKKDAEPVFKKARPVPYALQDAVDSELKKWEKMGIAERIEYSDWATPLVVVPKSGGGVRLCGDYKSTVNRQIEVPQHPMPNLEDMLPRLAGMKYFSKLDLTNAYLQMRLDEEGQRVTVLNTPRGLMKMKRLPYGISAAPATFQRAMERILENLPGTMCFLDDVLVAGATEAEALQRLDAVLKRLRKWKLVLKQIKCQFLMSSIQYLGVRVSDAVVETVQEKIDPVLDAPPPRDTGKLRSFLGAVTFYARFLPDMSTVAAPLNKLLQKREPWRWTATEKRSFNELKRRLASAPVLAHYDGRRPVKLITDASPHGVGAVLVQVGEDGEERPVRFASRSLSKAEKAYSQFDREGLGVIFGVSRYKQYLWGRRFTLVTDNKALTSILGPKANAPALATARLHRWALLLAAYSYDIEHRKAEEIPMADFLSRIPYDKPAESRNGPDEAIICFLEQMETLQPLSSRDLRRETSRDPVLSQVARYLHMGWPDQRSAMTKEMQPYANKKTELSLNNGCILWGGRVVIPNRLREKVLTELHQSHPGATKMKMLARSYVWWPNIDGDVELTVKACPGCQAVQKEQPAVFLHPWEHTARPWERVHLDFAGPFRGSNFMVMVDSHSKWPEVIEMQDIMSQSTIIELAKIFARWGNPVQLVTDNGAQLTSKEFEEFLTKQGIKHIRIAPYRPQANGLAERMVQTVKNSLKAHLSGGDQRPIELQLASFLLQYRNTPHSTTGVAPVEAMLGRKMRTRLDLLKPQSAERVLDAQAQLMRNHSQRLVEYKAGDNVLVRNYAGGQKWKKGAVLGRTGPVSYQVTVDGLIWSRHAGQLLPLIIESRQNQQSQENG